MDIGMKVAQRTVARAARQTVFEIMRRISSYLRNLLLLGIKFRLERLGFFDEPVGGGR